MFYHVKWYRKPLLRDEGGAFCVGKRVGAVAPYQYKVGCSKLASKVRSFLLHFKLPETRCKKTQALMGATRPASG